MTPQDRERLDGLLAAVERGVPESTPTLDAPHDAQPESPPEGLVVKAAQNGHASPLALGPGR
jgi:hypothetical protein